MNENKKTNLPAILITLFSICGLILSYILEIRHAGSSFAEGICGINSSFDCNAVTSSKYSKFFGVSLSQYGLFFYIFIIFISLKIFLSSQNLKGLKKLLVLITFFSSIFSLYLFFVSKFILNALCPFCIGLYIVNISSFIVAVYSYKMTNLLKEIKNSFSYFLIIALVVSVFLSLFIGDMVSHNQGSKEITDNDNSWVRNGSLGKYLRVDKGITKDYMLGSKDAPIEIVKFSDFQCPYCKRMSYSIDDIIKKHSKNIKFILKNYPLDASCNSNIQGEMHQSACYAAESARCVGEQGGFFDFIKDLYNLDVLSNPSYSPVSVRAAIRARVKLTGFDVEAVDECLKSGRQMKAIKQDIIDATKLQIKGTPSIYINGRLVEKPNEKKLEKIVKSLL